MASQGGTSSSSPSTATAATEPSTTPPPSAPPTGPTDFGARRRRRYAIVAIVVVILVVVAGVSIYEFVLKPTSSKVTITYYDDLSGTEASYVSGTIIPMFESAHSNISISYVDQTATAMVSTIQALVKGHSVGATVIGEDNLDIGELLYSNDLMNMSSFASQLEPTTMIPSMSGIVQYEVKEFGGTYFIPLRANVPLVWYNVTALNKAGITSAPTTDAQLLSDAGRLTAFYHNGGQLMFQGSSNSASAQTELFQWLTQFGGNPIVFNDSGDIAAMQYLYNLSAYFNAAYTGATFATYQGLGNGAYSILDYQWPYIYSNLYSAPPTGLGMPNSSIGVYPGPNGTVNSDHLVGGDVLAYPTGASNLWALNAFSKFLLGTPVQTLMLTQLSWPAVNQAAYANVTSTSPVYRAIATALDNPVFRPPVPWIDEWNTLMYDAFTKLVIDHGAYSSIPSVLASEHSALYSFLQSNYNSQTATNYNNGVYGPLIVT
jgi:trehalose transport system substrate-binding protein